MKKQNLYRTQVLLEPEQFRQLVELSESEGVSLSALLRRIVTQALQERRQKQLASAAEKLVDLYYSESDITGYSALDSDGFQAKG